jgi:hypothetical protein
MAAFFLLSCAFADQRQLYQAGFMAPYARPYVASATPQMYAPVTPEMTYANPAYVAAPYAYSAEYPNHTQKTAGTSGWLLALAGAAVGGALGYSAGSVQTVKVPSKVAMLFTSGSGKGPKKKEKTPPQGEPVTKPGSLLGALGSFWLGAITLFVISLVSNGGGN